MTEIRFSKEQWRVLLALESLFAKKPTGIFNIDEIIIEVYQTETMKPKNYRSSMIHRMNDISLKMMNAGLPAFRKLTYKGRGIISTYRFDADFGVPHDKLSET